MKRTSSDDNYWFPYKIITTVNHSVLAHVCLMASQGWSSVAGHLLPVPRSNELHLVRNNLLAKCVINLKLMRHLFHFLPRPIITLYGHAFLFAAQHIRNIDYVVEPLSARWFSLLPSRMSGLRLLHFFIINWVKARWWTRASYFAVNWRAAYILVCTERFFPFRTINRSTHSVGYPTRTHTNVLLPIS